MKKILFVVLSILFFSSKAFAQENNIEFQNLTQKVDSLEHELTYLNLNFQLTSKQQELNLFTTEIKSESNSILLNVLAQNFSKKLDDVYQLQVKAYERNLDSKIGYLKILKQYCALKLINFSFTENERDILIQQMEVIDTGISTAKATLDTLKVSVAMYHDLR